MKNWKTTAAGVVVLLTLVIKVVNQLIAGEPIVLDAEDLAIASAAVVGLAAKDHDKSGTR